MQAGKRQLLTALDDKVDQLDANGETTAMLFRGLGNNEARAAVV